LQSLENELVTGLKGDTFGVTGAATGLTGADFNFLGTAAVFLGVIRTLLHTAHNALNGVICFHLDTNPFLPA